jgi:hypothetical protein
MPDSIGMTSTSATTSAAPADPLSIVTRLPNCCSVLSLGQRLWIAFHPHPCGPPRPATMAIGRWPRAMR